MLTKMLDALTEHEPMTIDALAKACGVSVEETLRALHAETEAWWYVEQVPGSKGWLYRKRALQSGYVPNVMKCGNGGEG